MHALAQVQASLIYAQAQQKGKHLCLKTEDMEHTLKKLGRQKKCNQTLISTLWGPYLRWLLKNLDKIS